MITQLDSGNKWKYYTLTKKGKILIKGEETTHILIVIGASAVLLAFLLFGLLGTLSVSSLGVQTPMLSGSSFEESFGTAGDGVGQTASAPVADAVTELEKNAEADGYAPLRGNATAETEETPQLEFNEILASVAMIIIISAVMGYMFGLLHVRIKKKHQGF